MGDDTMTMTMNPTPDGVDIDHEQTEAGAPDGDDASAPSTKKAGRPRRGHRPFDEDEVDRLLVYGELVPGTDGTSEVRYPTYRDLARRQGVSPNTIAHFAKKRDCVKRRADVRGGVQRRVKGRSLSGGEQTPTGQRAGGILDATLLDAMLEDVADRIDRGVFRCDTVADLERLIRLRKEILTWSSGGKRMLPTVPAKIVLDDGPPYVVGGELSEEDKRSWIDFINGPPPDPEREALIALVKRDYWTPPRTDEIDPDSLLSDDYEGHSPPLDDAETPSGDPPAEH
jgi:hypothetical protein